MLKEELFLKNLDFYGGGHAISDAADYQDQIVDAVKRSGKKGKLTITMSFTRNGLNAVVVDVEVVPKIPNLLEKTAMYSGEDNLLHESNPDQLTHENVVLMDTKRTINK